MKQKTIQLLVLSLAIIFSGCSKSNSSSPMLEPAKIPSTVSQAFQSAPEETKQAVATFVETFQGQDAAGSFNQLRRLSAQENLSAQQREAVAKAMQVTFTKLQESAQKGNTAAQSAMHDYLSTR